MTKYKFRSILFLLIVGAAEMVSAQNSPTHHAKRAKSLNDIIENVSLTDGSQSIGGASIDDAANLLQDNVASPVALEMIEFERPKDFVTLDEALAKLRRIEAVGPLSANDKLRLDRYRELAKNHPGAEILVPRQRTFTFARTRLTVRDLLNAVTRLDDEYEWKNYGTDNNPVIVIQPRAESALNWIVAPICQPRPVRVEQVLAACKGQECGAFTKVLSEKNMAVLYMHIGPPSKKERQVPHGFVDLCSDDLNARDVLNRIAKSARTSWTLGGIKGMRFISFGEYY